MPLLKNETERQMFHQSKLFLLLTLNKMVQAVISTVMDWRKSERAWQNILSLLSKEHMLGFYCFNPHWYPFFLCITLARRGFSASGSERAVELFLSSTRSGAPHVKCHMNL